MAHYTQMDFSEIRQLQAGDEILIRICGEYIPAKVMRPIFWNGDADEPDWELETTNGFTDVYSVYRDGEDKHTMVHITKTEAAWIVNELRDRAKAYKGAAGLDFPKKSGLDAAFFNLRSEQLASIADRLEKAIQNSDKRIAID